MTRKFTTSIDMTGKPIRNLLDPVNVQDAVTLGYFNTHAAAPGGGGSDGGGGGGELPQLDLPMLVWSYRVPGKEPVYGSPIVANVAGVPSVVVQSWDWYLYVLGLADGTLTWRKAFGDVNYGRAQAADVNGDGKIEIFGASHDGQIWSLTDDGSLRWQFKNLYDREGSGTCTSGGTYQITDNSKNWALNAFTRRADDTSQNAEVEILTGPGAGAKSRISSIDASGKTIWVDTPLSPAPGAGSTYRINPRYESDIYWQHAGTLSLEGGTWFLYACGFDGQCVKINANTGALVWAVSSQESIEPFPLVADVDGDGQIEVVFPSVDGRIYCRNADGSELWTADLGYPPEGFDAYLQSADVDGDGVVEVIVSGRTNRVHWLDGKTGAEKAQSTDTGADIDSRPALFPTVAGKRDVLVAGDSGYAYRFRPDGTAAWRTPVAVGIGCNASPSVFDVNDDGGMECLIPDMGGGLTILDEQGRPRALLNAPGGIEGTPLVGDLDGDGKVEVLLTTINGYIQLYRFEPAEQSGVAGSDASNYSYNVNRSMAFIEAMMKPLEQPKTPSTITPVQEYPEQWTGALDGTFKLGMTLPATEQLCHINVADPGDSIPDIFRGTLYGNVTGVANPNTYKLVALKETDTEYVMPSTAGIDTNGNFALDLSSTPTWQKGRWRIRLEKISAAGVAVGALWPNKPTFVGLRVESSVITDSTYVIESQPAAADGTFHFLSTQQGRKRFSVRNAANDLIADYTPLTGNVRSYVVLPGQSGYGTGFEQSCYSYDQAVALCAAIAAGRSDLAARMVAGLLKMQNAGGTHDGAFIFSAPHLSPSYGDKLYRTGAHAICAYALLAYMAAYPGDTTYDYDAAATRAMEWLRDQIGSYGLVTGGYGNYANPDGSGAFDPNVTLTWMSVEHNLDSFHAFKLAAVVLDSSYEGDADSIQARIFDHLWDGSNGRFYQGMNVDGTPDTADPLDAHSWGAIFCDAIDDSRARTIMTEAQLEPYFATRTTPEGVTATGYAVAYDSPGYPGAVPNVWSEGTFGVAYALAKMGDPRWAEVMNGILPSQADDGSYFYVTDPDPSMELTPYHSTVGTAWSVLASLGYGIWDSGEPDSWRPQFSVTGIAEEPPVYFPFQDVKAQHGADGQGNNSIDDSTAILNAIETGEAVYFPEGIYMVSRNLALQNALYMFGVGARSVIRLMPNAGDVDMLSLTDAPASNVTIASLMIDGNKDQQNPAQNTTCLQLHNITNLELRELIIANSLIEGAYAYLCDSPKVVDCYAIGNGFRRADASGIHLDSCTHGEIRGTTSIQNGFHGIIFSSTVDSAVSDSFCINNGYDGLRMQYNSDRNKLSSVISKNNFRGIYFTTDSTLNQMALSTMIDNEASGLVFNNAYNNYFISNHLQNNAYAIETVTAADINYGWNNTRRGNRSGATSLVAGSAFNLIPNAALTAI